MTVLVSALLPVTIIILIGFAAAKTINLDQKSLSKLSVYILSPGLVVTSLYRTQLGGESITLLLGGFVLITLILSVMAWLIGRIFKLKPASQKSLIATTILPNTGNMGLPLNAFVYGTAGLERAIVYLIGASILMFGITPALLKGGGWRSGIKLTTKLPLFWAILAGLSLRILSIKLPSNLDDGINQLGMAAIPIGLLILGVQLANTSTQISMYEIGAASLRLILAPIVAYGVGNLLNLQGLDLQVLVLQSSMPVAVNSVVLVTEFGGDAAMVARTVVVSTILSFLTLPVVIAIN